MLKAVLDTNTLVSAFFWRGNEYRLFKKIEEGKIKLFLSKEIVDEVEDVINREKFKDIIEKTNQRPDEIIQKIISVSHIVIGPKLNIRICRDPKDNKFIECGINANVDYIVSGDKDLLDLKMYKNINIIKTSNMLKKNTER